VLSVLGGRVGLGRGVGDTRVRVVSARLFGGLVASGVGVAVSVSLAVGLGVAVALGVVVGVGNTTGTTVWAGVVSGVTVGAGVGFGVSSFGTGVALTTAVAVGIVRGVMLGAAVAINPPNTVILPASTAATVAVGVGDAENELTPLVEPNGKCRSKCWPSASATVLTLSGTFVAANKTL
jgi:hypothetical protein